MPEIPGWPRASSLGGWNEKHLGGNGSVFGNLEGKGAGEVELFVKDQPFPFPAFFDFATAHPGAPGGQSLK